MDTTKKKEGDKKTPKGTFKLKIYILEKIDKKPKTIKMYEIKKNMGWCDDAKVKINKEIKMIIKIKHEKLIEKIINMIINSN